MDRFIQGDKFRDLADFTYAPAIRHVDDYDGLTNTLEIGLLEDYDIIYTHTFYAKQLFEVIQDVEKNLIVVTHNDDNEIDSSYMLPDNVIRWYAVNVQVHNPRIRSIPIGICNDRWFPWMNRKETILKQNEQQRDYRNLAYMNFDIRTSPAKRKPVYDAFKDKTWVTTRMGVNTVDYEDYIENIYNHSFVICPGGNGTSTHRTWETLYLGSIPIEKINGDNVNYTDLPILLVNDWSEVTEEFLNEKWIEMQGKTWNLDKLNFNYWKKLITND